MVSNVKIVPHVSVLMPVYNCETYICEAIESILNQSFSNFECIIIDDKSTDETVKLIQSYQDHRIQLIQKPKNTGLTDSLNLGLKIAKGKFIARMDGDDISLPQRFEKQVSFLELNHEYVLCGSNYTIMGSNMLVKLPQNHENIKVALLQKCLVAHPTVMMRKELLDKFELCYDATKEPAEDYDFWVRMIGKGKFHNLQESLLQYRVHNEQVSQQRAIQQRFQSAEAKIQLLKQLELQLLDNEVNILRKIFISDKKITHQDIIDFSFLKNKLKVGNANFFFESKAFDMFIKDVEQKIIRSYYMKKERYFPSDYYQYRNMKSDYKLQFSFSDEIKLIIKSFSFYKYKK